MKDAISHYCLVTLNLSAKRFEFLDSINGPESDSASTVFRKMVKNIKKVWKDGSASCDEPLNPPTLDGFVLSHVNVPQQENGFALVLSIFCAYSVSALLYENTEAFIPIRVNCINICVTSCSTFLLFFLFLHSEIYCFTVFSITFSG